MDWLWPVSTGKTFFDIPSIFHFCFWVFVGSCFAYVRLPIKAAMCWMLAGAVAWEVFERYAEKKWPTYWLHPEIWHNAYVSDILMGVAGVWLAYWLVSKQ